MNNRVVAALKQVLTSSTTPRLDNFPISANIVIQIITTMRNIINISLPPELTKKVQQEVKTGNYASISEFFRHLLRTHELAEELKKARNNFDRRKNWKILKSLKDLR